MAFGLTAVAGLEVGHFTDARRPTGCTVVLARDGAVGGVDVRGASPGTRETELLAPRTSTPPTAPSRARTTVQPVGRRVSVK